MEGTCEWKKGYTCNGFCLFLVLVVTIIISHTYVYLFYKHPTLIIIFQKIFAMKEKIGFSSGLSVFANSSSLYTQNKVL